MSKTSLSHYKVNLTFTLHPRIRHRNIKAFVNEADIHTRMGETQVSRNHNTLITCS